MKKLVLLFLIGSLISCNNNSELKEVQVLFAPSFLYPTKFTIDVKSKTIEQYIFQKSYFVKEWIDTNAYTGHWKDTLVVHYRKSFLIDDEVLNEFLREVKSSRLDSTIENRELVLDGISFRVSKMGKKNDTISLTSNITRRDEDSKLVYKLLDAFFDLANQTIDDYDGISSIENIQDYFDYELPLRKVNDKPLEYRVWGSFTGCKSDNPKLVEFLESIPPNEPVIFDLRNGSFSICLYSLLKEYENQKFIYYYGNFEKTKNEQEIKVLREELKVAISNKNELSIQNIKNELESSLWYREEISRMEIPNIFSTRAELMETIANTDFNR